jgi:hypothetical protein
MGRGGEAERARQGRRPSTSGRGKSCAPERGGREGRAMDGSCPGRTGPRAGRSRRDRVQGKGARGEAHGAERTRRGRHGRARPRHGRDARRARPREQGKGKGKKGRGAGRMGGEAQHGRGDGGTGGRRWVGPIGDEVEGEEGVVR